MLSAPESRGSTFANVTPLASGVMRSKSGGVDARSRQLAATRRSNRRVLRKRTQYSLKNVVVLALLAGGCQEKPIDQGALLTARTVGLAQLERGQLAEAEQEFKTVISLAPKDASGHANLGLTYLRANRLAEAESELKRAHKLDARSPEVALILARLYVLTKRPDDATRALAGIEPEPRVLYTLAQIDRRTSGDTVYSAR